MRPYSSVGVADTRPALFAAFPHGGTPEDKLRYLVRYAILAPSGHNMQPWKFRIEGNTLDLFGDFSRSLPAADPQNRELVMSCGAALLNLRVALRNFGYTAIVDLCPDPDVPTQLATVKLMGQAPAGRTDHRLFKAIPERRTNRNAFENRPIPRALLYRWQRAAGYEDSWLHLVESDEERETIAELVAEGDRELSGRRDYRQELSVWLRPNQVSDGPNRDGVPGHALGLGDLASTLRGNLSFCVNDEQRDRDLVRRAPAFFVLGTDDDNIEAWMIAGQALGRVLLGAQSEGVAASFFLQPIEIPRLRERLIEVTREIGYPQITFRLGYGTRVPPTPRRPMHDVVIGAEEPPFSFSSQEKVNA